MTEPEVIWELEYERFTKDLAACDRRIKKLNEKRRHLIQMLERVRRNLSVFCSECGTSQQVQTLEIINFYDLYRDCDDTVRENWYAWFCTQCPAFFRFKEIFDSRFPAITMPSVLERYVAQIHETREYNIRNLTGRLALLAKRTIADLEAKEAERIKREEIARAKAVLEKYGS